MQKHEEVTKSRKSIIINNFLGGISWGLGASIGVSLLLALVTLFAHYIDFVPVVGSFISQILDFVLKTNHHFK